MIHLMIIIFVASVFCRVDVYACGMVASRSRTLNSIDKERAGVENILKGDSLADWESWRPVSFYYNFNEFRFAFVCWTFFAYFYVYVSLKCTQKELDTNVMNHGYWKSCWSSMFFLFSVVAFIFMYNILDRQWERKREKVWERERKRLF